MRIGSVQVQDTHIMKVLNLIWLIIAFISFGLFTISICVQYSAYQLPCVSNSCIDLSQLTMQEANELKALGYPVTSYALFKTVMELLKGIGFFSAGILIFWKKLNERFAWLVSMLLITLGTTMEMEIMRQAYPGLDQIIRGIQFIASSIIILIFLFPNGKFVPNWTAFAAGLWLLGTFGRTFMPNSVIDPLSWPLWLISIGLISYGFIAVYAQIYRFRKMPDPIQRQQAKWFIISLTAGALSFILAELLNHAEGSISKIVLTVLLTVSVTFIPFTIATAVMQYMLWELDVYFNRFAVYILLSGIVAVIYAGIVGMLGTIIQVRGSFFVAMIASGVIAVLFQPIREKLQTSVNRLMYGESLSPYVALSLLGQKLEATADPQTVLPSVVETIGQVLKLPYAAIYLKTGDSLHLAADYGKLNTRQVSMNLTYHNEKVGELILGVRPSYEGFAQHEYRLIQDLSRHVGLAAYSVKLTTDLIKSRDNLVKAREEEKRRIRRDLHDGLGPQLASLGMNLEAARNLYKENPDAADELLAKSRNQLQNAIIEIRQLVYALRPPALDELGLMFAINELIMQYHNSEITMKVLGPSRIPMLPAAVEVAAYRIVQESITNVTRHSQAKSCIVKVTLSDNLQIEIQDNGIGIDTDARKGIGMFSMRERTEELGGSFEIVSLPDQGTRVQAIFPLPEKENRHGNDKDTIC